MIFKLLAGVALTLALTPAAPAQAATRGDCSAYTYLGTGTSLCADFPGSADRDCDDVVYRVSVGKSDPWRLDGNGPAKGDGIGCESNPLYPKPTAEPHPDEPTATAKPKPSKSTAPAGVDAGPQLPKTGPAAPVLGGIGVAVLAGGIGVAAIARRRRTRFEA